MYMIAGSVGLAMASYALARLNYQVGPAVTNWLAFTSSICLFLVAVFMLLKEKDTDDSN